MLRGIAFALCLGSFAGCRPASKPVVQESQTVKPDTAQAPDLGTAGAGGTAETPPVGESAKVAGVAHELTADDGHTLAIWAKVAPEPKGAILLVHGRTWSGRPDFDLQVEGGPERSLMDSLVARGFATYALDLRGYGKTPRDASEFITPDRAAQDVVHTLIWIASRHPELKKPALFGWSLGSLVAQLAAQNHPELVSDLILYGYPREPGRKAPKPKANASETPPERKTTTARAAAEDFRLPKYVDLKTVKAFADAAVAADPVRADWRDNHQFNVLDPRLVKTPTLVIHGRHDPYAPIKNQARLVAELGTEDRSWVVVPHGDHAAHLEQAHERFVAALVGFLDRPPVPEI